MKGNINFDRKKIFSIVKKTLAQEVDLVNVDCELPEGPNLGCKLIIVLLAFIIAGYIAGIVYSYSFTVDDTYISLRYAENLVNYGQLSFNPGEQPTEGYTNFLLILIEALFIKLGLQNPVIIPKLVGIVSGILTIVFVYKLSELAMEFTNPWVRFLPSIATAASTPFIVWSVGGLETVLFTFLIVAGMYFFILSTKSNIFKHVFLSDLFFCLAVFSRPEGLLFWVLSYIYLAVNYKEANLKKRIKSTLIFASVFTTYLVWKYFYFGNIIPLTFYIKTSKVGAFSPFIDGFARFMYLLKINLNFVYLLFFLVAAVISLYKKSRIITYIAFLSTSYVLYVFSLGYSVAMDDIFRLYVPFLPLFYVVAAAGGGYAGKKLSVKAPKVFYIALIFLVFSQVIIGMNDMNVCWNKDHNFGSRADAKEDLKTYQTGWDDFKYLGIWLRNTVPANSTIVIPDIGAISYFSKLKIIDSWSLVTKEIILIRSQQLKYPSGSPEREQLNKKIIKFILDKNPEIIVIQYYEYGRYQSDPRINQYTALGVSGPKSGRPFLLAIRPDMVKYFTPKP